MSDEDLTKAMRRAIGTYDNQMIIDIANSCIKVTKKYLSVTHNTLNIQHFTKFLQYYRGDNINKEDIAVINTFVESNVQDYRQEWLNAELHTPFNAQQIIFIDNGGMFKGTYYRYPGVVKVDNKNSDIIAWSDINEWIVYPKH